MLGEAGARVVLEVPEGDELSSVVSDGERVAPR